MCCADWGPQRPILPASSARRIWPGAAPTQDRIGLAIDPSPINEARSPMAYQPTGKKHRHYRSRPRDDDRCSLRRRTMIHEVSSKQRQRHHCPKRTHLAKYSRAQLGPLHAPPVLLFLFNLGHKTGKGSRFEFLPLFGLSWRWQPHTRRSPPPGRGSHFSGHLRALPSFEFS